MKQMQVRLLSMQSGAQSGQVQIENFDIITHFSDVGTKAVHKTRYYELLRHLCVHRCSVRGCWIMSVTENHHLETFKQN